MSFGNITCRFKFEATNQLPRFPNIVSLIDNWIAAVRLAPEAFMASGGTDRVGQQKMPDMPIPIRAQRGRARTAFFS